MENASDHGERSPRSYRARHLLSQTVACSLKRALAESQLSYRSAAAEIGITHGYLHALVKGARCPSRTVARGLARVLPLGPAETLALMAEAVDG